MSEKLETGGKMTGKEIKDLLLSSNGAVIAEKYNLTHPSEDTPLAKACAERVRAKYESRKTDYDWRMEYVERCLSEVSDDDVFEGF